jgi:multidrug efflux pump subunit AcrA (membrane-fusion protein)
VATIQPSGTTTSNVVTYNALISVDTTDVTLLPSMTATVTIVTEQHTGAVLVPNSALSYAAAPNAAVVLRNGAPTRVPIQTGATDGTQTVVLSGLEPGDQVVTSASGTSSASRTSSSTSSSSNVFGIGAPGGGAARPQAPAAPAGTTR